MLTRLQVDGFKNLRAVDLRLGHLTCIAGSNGVGKSNLFDAIAFLSDLASMPLLNAATRVRGTGGRLSGIDQLFSSYGQAERRLRLSAEMIVPRTVFDDFDRKAVATATCLRYSISLIYEEPVGERDDGQALRVETEELTALSLAAATEALKFKPSKWWRARYLKGPGARTSPFISTVTGDTIKLWGDKGSGGRPLTVPAAKTPQTVLSGVNTSTHPTALAVRREMQSWRLLQLEPSALRSPDEFNSEKFLSSTGAHLPNTLRRIACQAELANVLSELVPGVVSIDVDSDEARQQRTLRVTLRDRQSYEASSLSDGSLRFIALGLLGLDAQSNGLVCLEEPENSIHPQRIAEMMSLVTRLSEQQDGWDDVVDAGLAVAPRQVIINTHSPLVVGQLPDSDLLMAETLRQQGREWVAFKPLADTWRAAGLAATDLVSKGELQAYLGVGIVNTSKKLAKGRTVRDHLTGDLFAS